MTEPASRWWLDRASSRTPDEREQHYLEWLHKTDREDTDELRETWFRRYRQPSPPDFLSIPNIGAEV